mgnify:CR=1 FL=1
MIRHTLLNLSVGESKAYFKNKKDMAVLKDGIGGHKEQLFL